MKKPLLICLTPVRNEAWILKAFLRATSLWADYIIIADQGSTDDSRKIALSFPKVILVDNLEADMHQANARKLLLNEANKIKENKIIFALDADEFLSGNFDQSIGWKKIINSNPGEMFFFKWINFDPGLCEYSTGTTWMYWACHVNNDLQDGLFPDNYIHEWRLPYLNKTPSENYIDDIWFLHFAHANKQRQKNKERFYQVITKSKQPHISSVSLYRMYHHLNTNKTLTTNYLFSFYLLNNINIEQEIDFSDEGIHYTDSILKIFNSNNTNQFKYLDIWDPAFINQNNIKDPRTFISKFLLFYLAHSLKYSNSFIIKAIDSIIKRVNF